MSNKKIITGRQINGVWEETYPKTVSANVYMEEYAKAAQAEAILPTDTANQAIGKLEKMAEQLAAARKTAFVVLYADQLSIPAGVTSNMSYSVVKLNSAGLNIEPAGENFTVPEGYNMARWWGSIDADENFNNCNLKPQIVMSAENGDPAVVDLSATMPMVHCPQQLGDVQFTLTTINCTEAVHEVKAGDKIGYVIENGGANALNIRRQKLMIELFNI